jgi:16S rRNA (uracil1498-N3)-methyltransferase
MSKRFFFEKLFKVGEVIELEKEEFHHLKHVMRCQELEEVELVNGMGELAFTKIISIGKNRAFLKVVKVFLKEVLDGGITLVVAVIRIPKLELILEKGVELGVKNFIIFNAKNSERINISGLKLKRFKIIMISALKQSKELYLPKVSFLKGLEEFKLRGECLFGDTRENSKNILNFLKKDKSYSFFVGPEKGFTGDEIDFLEKVLKARGVRLNKNVLRTETAAITACGILASFQVF